MFSKYFRNLGFLTYVLQQQKKNLLGKIFMFSARQDNFFARKRHGNREVKYLKNLRTLC